MTSTKGCRLKATDRATIRVKGATGVTGGYVDLSTVNGRTRRAVSKNKAKGRHKRPRG
jgi:hypothetical protein